MTQNLKGAFVASALLTASGFASCANAAGASAPAPGAAFTQSLSNTAPLVFGMTADDAANALGVPLIYVQGRLGNETFFAIRNDGGSGFFPRDDRLYLQFRRGRLTGIKGDWGRNWMWRQN